MGLLKQTACMRWSFSIFLPFLCSLYVISHHAQEITGPGFWSSRAFFQIYFLCAIRLCLENIEEWTRKSTVPRSMTWGNRSSCELFIRLWKLTLDSKATASLHTYRRSTCYTEPAIHHYLQVRIWTKLCQTQIQRHECTVQISGPAELGSQNCMPHFFQI
jgi:hypothetical protein